MNQINITIVIIKVEKEIIIKFKYCYFLNSKDYKK